MASVVEELVVQSSLCPCPCVMDKAVQVQGLLCTGCGCSAQRDGCTYLELPQSTSEILQLLSAAISLSISCWMWCILSGC